MSGQRKAPSGTITGRTLDTTWRTPPWLLAVLAAYFGGQIPFDVCNSEDNWTGAADWCAFSDEGDETVWSVMGGVPVKGIVGLTAGLGRFGLLNQ